jgi:multidrug efflux pump subunit AcrA (membrane-fusion protein)
MSFFSTVWSDKSVRGGLLVALAFLLALCGWLLWGAPPSADAQALHYNIYFGIDLFGPGRSLWLHPAAVAVVLITNGIVAALAVERQSVAARIAAWSAAVFAAIVFAATILIGVFVSRA